MKQVGQKFVVVAISVSLFCLSGVTFAGGNTPETPSYPSFTQVKPEAPGKESTFPNMPPNRENVALLDHPPLERNAPVMVSEYWIGVQCEEIMPALRSHLNLGEHEGMLVEGVMPDSPAAKSGVEQYDVILAVNGKPVQKIEDIIRTVDEVKDREMTISAIRKGKPLEIKVIPEKRPANAKLPAMPRQGFFRSFGPGMEWTPMPSPNVQQQDLPDMQRLMEQIQKQMEDQMKNLPESGRFRIESLPGGFGDMQIFGVPDAGTNTIQMTIDPAHGDREATLTVRKNGKTWSVSHFSDFSDLPDEVQRDVAGILENTVDGKDVTEWITEQMKNNRRMTFSVTTSGNAPGHPRVSE